jgi:hypothetical protein
MLINFRYFYPLTIAQNTIDTSGTPGGGAFKKLVQSKNKNNK